MFYRFLTIKTITSGFTGYEFSRKIHLNKDVINGKYYVQGAVLIGMQI